MTSNEARSVPRIGVEVGFPRPGVAVVALRGEHDLSTADAVADALAKAAKRIDVLIDLSECTFMDSTIVAALMASRRVVDERGGRIVLVIPPHAAEPRRLLALTHLDAVLPVAETRAAGLQRLRSGEHEFAVRDRRERFGDDPAFAAECCCGWQGPLRDHLQNGSRDARRDGAIHVDEHVSALRERRNATLRNRG